MDSLVREGHLFMRPLADFVRMERDALRGDSDEGLTTYLQAPGAELRRADESGEWQTLGTVNGALRYRDPGALDPNVFCMSALLRSQVPLEMDNRVLGFGNTFVLFKDADEFLRRVRNTAERAGLSIEWKLVEYIDPANYSGWMGPFRKLSSFAYQSEFRIMITPGTGQPFSLNVGDLSDIAILGRAREINTRLRFEDGRLSVRTS